MNHIAVVTSSRAEYGLLRNTLKLFQGDDDIHLSLIVTGSHLSKEFGESKQEIIDDGFTITSEIDSLAGSDGELSSATSMAKLLSDCSGVLNELKPDFLLILGDRFEILAAAISATLLRIPIAHIHGGEVTLGSMDDTFRHAITKMSHIHFAATKLARNRIIQMGENPEYVFLVGGVGADNIQKLNLLSQVELEKKYGIKFAERNLLITYHPDTLNPESSLTQFKELLGALELQNDTLMIFTAPNVDSGGKEILSILKFFVSTKKNCVLIESFGFRDYISIASFSNGVIGNSSSSFLEIPSLGVGSINIGDRQRGRELASSIINCEPTKESISLALEELYTEAFQESLKNVENPYGSGGAAEKIFEVMKIIKVEELRFKPFINIL